MSGFVAIIANASGGSVPETDIAAFAAAYIAVRGGTADVVQAGGRVRAALVRSEDSAAVVDRDGDSWALSAGTPHHARPLLNTGPDEIEGQFALLRHDAASGITTLLSDPFGMFGLFVAERDGLTYVATSALALARYLRSVPSVLALQTFLLAGYQCGTQTNWEGIERVPGGTRFDFGPTGRKRTSYWHPTVDHSIQRLAVSESVEVCVERATDAVRAAGAGRDLVWCDLTGGYDTRMLTLLARAAGVAFITSTSGEGDEEDVRIARRIAEAAGWDWSLILLPDDWRSLLPSRISEAVGWGDAMLDAIQLAGVLWAHEYKAKRARGLLVGGGGEHYWSYAWQHEYGRSRLSGPTNLDLWVRIRMLRAVQTRVFAHDPRPGVVSDLRARMRPVIEPYLDEPRAVQADALYLHKSTGHFGAYTAAGAAHIDAMLPFYTRASFTAAFSTHPRHRFGHRFYRRLIDRMDPSIAGLPTAKGGPAQPPRLSNVTAFAPYYARLGEKGLNKVAQRLLGRSFRTPPGLDDDNAASIRTSVLAAVGTNLDEWRSGALYDRSELTTMLAAAVRPDFRESVLLARIVTTELGLRAAEAFIGEDGTRMQPGYAAASRS